MIELKYNSQTLLIQPDDSSFRYRTIMGEHSVTLVFDLPEYVDIPQDAYIDYQGERYTRRQPAAFVKNGPRNYRYTLILGAAQMRLKDYILYNPIDGRLEFDMHARPIEFAQMIVANLNAREGAGVWSVDDTTLDWGKPKIEAEAQVVAFSYTTLHEALQMVADAFGTEWEINGTALRIGRVEYNKTNSLALPLSYGAGKGIEPGTGRSNFDQSDAVARLYVQGGERNIDPSTYGKKTLRLPLNQLIHFDGYYFEDEPGYHHTSATTFRYRSSPDGLSVARAWIHIPSRREAVIDCTHHYPSELHAVTSVILVDAERHHYDVVVDAPEDIPYNSDTLRIVGEQATIIFQSGMLAGREFDLHTDDDGVILAEKVFDGSTFVGWRLPIVPAEHDGILMPDPATNYKPTVGDTLRVFGITLPQDYICNNTTKTGASWRMMREAIRWLYYNEMPRYSFTGKLQRSYARTNWGAIGPKIKLGGYVRFSDDQFLQTPQLIRIIGIKDFINDPYAPEIELSNTTCSVGFSSELAKYDADEVRAENAAKSVREYAQRRWRDAKVSQAMIEEALLKEFSNTISPIAVNTMQAIFGAESLQYDFITSLTNDTVVDHALDVTASQLTAPAAFIKHHTIGIDAVQPNRAAGEYLRWSVSALTFALQTDKSYYLYIKASKSSNTATFVASESAIAYDADPDHYHLLYATIGILQGEERAVTKWNGYTELTPGRITAYKFLSSDGLQYIDFLTKKARIGDANTFIDWNSNGDGKLKIRGTIVQSPSGAESVIGCYREAFNVNLSYYVGDMVTYQGTTYRCIKNTTTGATEPPTNTTYWAVAAAAGVSGLNTAIVYLYKRSATKPTRDFTTPIVYNFNTGFDDTTYGTWHTNLGALTGVDPIWVIAATALEDEDSPGDATIAANQWSEPVKWAGDGAPGLNSATVMLYQRATSVPAKPEGNLTYTFATGALSGTLGNWSQTIPANNGQPCWVIQATAISSDATDVIAATEWSDVRGLVADGATGLRNAIVYLYKRSATTPTRDFTTNVTYDFSTGFTASTYGTWKASIADAAGSDELWVLAATARETTPNGGTAVISPAEWAAPVKPAENGLNSATAVLYQRTAGAPAKPAGALTYTFATGVLSGTLGNWSQTIPASNGLPCWVIQATAISSGATDVIEASEWSTAVKLVEDGLNGCPLRGVTEWQAGRRYEGGNPRAGDEYQDIVVYDGSFYVCTETHTATAADTPPTLMGAKWKAGSQFDFVATKIAYIKKTLIENAVIDTLQTQEVNGGRIEAIGDRISSYKNNVEKLKIHSGSLSPLAGGGSNTYDIASSSKTHTHTHTGSNPITLYGEGESELATVNPAVDYNQIIVPTLTIDFSTNASEPNDTGATVSWALEFGGILISNGMFDSPGSITTPAKTISLPKGVNSTLKLYYSYELMSRGNSVSFTLASNAKSGNAIVYSVSGFTEVASDGFKSQWASNKYLYIDLDDGMKMQYGNARLELDETNGIKASHIGANDTFAVVAKDIKEIKVVTAMPSTPDNNTLYILTP